MGGGGALLTRARHRAAVAEAARWLDEAAGSRVPEVASEGLRGARLALGRLTGEGGRAEAVLDSIFGAFCIGK